MKKLLKIHSAVIMTVGVLVVYGTSGLLFGHPLQKVLDELITLSVGIITLVVVVFALYGLSIFYEEYKHKIWYEKHGHDYDENQPLVSSTYEAYKHAKWCKDHGYQLGKNKKSFSEPDKVTNNKEEPTTVD